MGQVLLEISILQETLRCWRHRIARIAFTLQRRTRAARGAFRGSDR